MSEKLSNEHKHEKIGTSSIQEEQNVQSTFIQDRFFEKGNVWLKVRQVVLNLLFLTVLVVPILILFNSIAKKRIWKKLYYWTYQDGFQLTNYLKTSILLVFVFILVCSLVFLFRNNYMEKKVYPNKKTYDEKKLKERKALLNKLYAERFGDKNFRESTKYFVVEGKKNLPDHMVDKLFKEGGVEIK